MTNEVDRYRFSGRIFRASEIALIREVVATCVGLSRKELANTISELVRWTRPGGALKEPECLAVLARLEAAGHLTLPPKQQTRPVGSVTSLPRTARGEPARRRRAAWRRFRRCGCSESSTSRTGGCFVNWSAATMI